MQCVYGTKTGYDKKIVFVSEDGDTDDVIEHLKSVVKNGVDLDFNQGTLSCTELGSGQGGGCGCDDDDYCDCAQKTCERDFTVDKQLSLELSTWGEVGCKEEEMTPGDSYEYEDQDPEDPTSGNVDKFGKADA